MINHIYELICPGTVSVKAEDISFGDKMIIRPTHMAVCHADQRYFQGLRDSATLKKKLPMALIHECCGRVVYDPTGSLKKGTQVVLIPNVPPKDFKKGEIYENYSEGARFLSSGFDGFMQELVEIEPDRVVPCEGVEPETAAIAEFISVAVHAVSRFEKLSHSRKDRIGVWGDGSLAFVVANVLRSLYPESKVIVVGKQQSKLNQFSFVNETYIAEELPEDFSIDHAFECCGGGGSVFAIEDIIDHIKPQGALVLMGVSENEVPINTRMVLEKGMTLIGCSRSGREEFEKAAELLSDRRFSRRLRVIISTDEPVRDIKGIYRVFKNDLSTPFKTVFKWEI